ncbi:MAG: hypothetical protein JWR44_1132 [Hymenobacter sp.]|nr:hypothetical protein [Hymenobacter sp.]
MVKTRLLTLLLLCQSLAAQAQTYYLDLTYRTLNLPYRAVAVEQVVDGRPASAPIGIVYQGMRGKSAAVAFRRGPAAELTDFLQAQLPARPTDHRVVLCLRTLHIGETVGGAKEQALADLSADVYEHLPTGYHFVRRVGGHASATGRETTSRHPEHLVQLLSESVNQLAAADWAAVSRQPARTLAELPTDAPAALAAGGKRGPAILRETLRRGIYYRFEQFLANRPDTFLTFKVDTIRRRYRSELSQAKWEGIARVRPLVAVGRGSYDVPTGVWGFSYGQQAFVQYDKQFFPLMRQSSFFTFVAEAPTDQLHAAALAEAQGRTAVLAGAVGAALARTRVPDHTAEPMAYRLDLLTGALGPYPGLHAPAPNDTAYVYVYRPLQAGSVVPVMVYAEGQAVGSLLPGQYLEVPWSRFGKPLKLCLTGIPTAGSCQYVVPNTAQLNYLRINPATAGRPWQWVPPAQGSAELDEIDKKAK